LQAVPLFRLKHSHAENAVSQRYTKNKEEIALLFHINVNRCLRYILRIRWPNVISNKDLWRITGQEDINLEIRKRKCRWIGHTLRKEDGEIPKAALL